MIKRSPFIKACYFVIIRNSNKNTNDWLNVILQETAQYRQQKICFPIMKRLARPGQQGYFL